MLCLCKLIFNHHYYLCISVGFRLVPLPLIELSFGADRHQLGVQSADAHKLGAVLQEPNGKEKDQLYKQEINGLNLESWKMSPRDMQENTSQNYYSRPEIQYSDIKRFHNSYSSI